MKTGAEFCKPIATDKDSGRFPDWVVGITLVFLIGLCDPPGWAQRALVLVGSGSSVPAPLYTRWAQEYNKRDSAIQVDYISIGTSEGIKQISNDIGDFGAGEFPLTDRDRNERHLTEIPSMLIAIVPIYNLPGVLADLRLSGNVLAEIFLGQVKTWNDSRIARLNPDVSLPNLPIKVVYRPAGKGSNYIFTEFLSKTSSDFRSRIGTSASPSWPVGKPATGSSGMADKVRSEVGSIGYVEAQYAVIAGIQSARVLNPAGRYIKASPQTLAAACLAVEAPSWDAFSASLTNGPGADSFPITSFTWLYLSTPSADPRRATALGDLLNWIFTDGEQLATQEGYSALPKPLLAKVKARVSALH
jgi:phosphate transport system substrate-binding protein